jgi:chromosome segregation ATPase
MSTEERVTQLEQAFVTVTQLLHNHSERLDTHMDWINQLGAAQAENDRRYAQLIDEHIRTDDEFKKLAASQQRTEEALRQLAESQRQTNAKVFDTDARLDRIAEAVERMTQSGRERPEG